MFNPCTRELRMLTQEEWDERRAADHERHAAMHVACDLDTAVFGKVYAPAWVQEDALVPSVAEVLAAMDKAASTERYTRINELIMDKLHAMTTESMLGAHVATPRTAFPDAHMDFVVAPQSSSSSHDRRARKLEKKAQKAENSARRKK
jgi:hypothetical protein